MENALEVKPLRQKPGKKPGSKLFTDFQKMEAVKLWLACGSPTHVGAALGINRRTIHIWMNSDWWKRVVEEIRTEGRFVLSKRLRTIVDKSLDVLSDRLENGDFVFNRDTGEVTRKPISAKDAHKIASDFIDKGEKLEKPLQETNTATEDRLTQLADAFAKFASKTTRIEVIDASPINKSDGNLKSEILNAIPIERKEGLFEGTPVGITSPGTEETKSGTDGSQTGRRESREGSPRGQTSGGPHQAPESWRQQLPRELESGS